MALELARLHWSLDVGAPVRLAFPPERPPRDLVDVVTGAGFEVEAIDAAEDRILVRGRRMRTLPDTVGPGMRLLVCGLNPSLYAADAGVGFARPGNRFWPAAVAAGLVSRDRDPVHALVHHGVGLTDLVKRATARADELGVHEYRAGLCRVERLVAGLRPGAVCMVGLAGWRAATDRTAVPGPQDLHLGGVPVYVMPSTSGANAHAKLPDLTEHLRRAVACAAVNRRRPRTEPGRRRRTSRAPRAR